MLRLAGSLKLGRVSAAGIMRMFQVGDWPTRLAQAVAEFGRIDKTLHTLAGHYSADSADLAAAVGVAGVGGVSHDATLRSICA